MTLAQFRVALIQDFNYLYVREFTTDYKIQRLIRRLEINVMDFPSVMNLIAKKKRKKKLDTIPTLSL